MKASIRFQVLIIGLLLAAGCSSLPGLRVLSGEDTGTASGDRSVQDTTLVMADKTGLTDPTILGDGDRIEQAYGGALDIIEIRRDLNTHVFSVYLLLQIQGGQNATTTDVYTQIERALELTWQGTLKQSEGSDVLKVVLLQPVTISTLDNGPSFAAVTLLNTQIARSDAITYLANRNGLQGFVDLISNGTLDFRQPSQTEIYGGVPNHPLFMLSSTQAAQAQQGSTSQVNQGN